MHSRWTRREWLALTPTAVGSGLALAADEPAKGAPAAEPFGYCLNTSTISGQKLDLVQVVEIAAKAGYQGIEPWIRELDEYVKKGGNLKDLGQRLRDHGLAVPSAIGFSEWIVDDEARRKRGLEDVKRSMDLVRQIGGVRLAAPPAGATNQADLSLPRITERYRALLELGEQMEVVPQLELWGFSRTLSRLSETAYVVVEVGHPKACLLADVYHLYKGGSNPAGLRMLNGSALHVLHFNDYPADPPRASIVDAQRVYPGDGVAPLKDIVRDLKAIGYRGMLSLELFNRDYWKQDPLAVARTGLEKMRAVVHNSLN